ncbi:trans-Golgi network-localized SYP41-interacting protein 1 isoform X2 [Ziziphus jujuba]|uniref:Trans-Golgi network-localized SYP41-interacting protein 1 isoform X2 n=1 Tax=Ziziphus jujuba TaxID=326968 RepID=A0A6P4AIA3_ZIZJJ|nr:trans-Golgi network-localized SYP41-interacting protein 1 isoform X2 [Ziziphus jujuba]
MSENRDTVRGFGAVEDREQPPSPSDSDHVDSPDDPNGFVHVKTPSFTNENDVGGSLYQEDRFGDDNGGEVPSGRDPDEGKVTEDAAKEDMFVDCPDELVGNAEGKGPVEMEENSEEKLDFRRENVEQLGFPAFDELERIRAMPEKTEEREAFAREVDNLRNQLKALTHQLPELVSEDKTSELVTHASLSVLMNECSRVINSVYEERLQTEATIRELQSVLVMKDQEIEDLNMKVSEFSALNKSIEVSSEVQREKAMYLEMVTNRVLASLAGVIGQQGLLDDSIGGKLDYVEKGTYFLVEKYREILFEVDQLRLCLSDDRVNVGIQEEFGTVFAAAREELLELKRKELEFAEKLSNLEDENRKLVEQLDNQRRMAETVNEELGKTKMELEQEKVRSANMREKLNMAVTKGKGLVQQRDSLKKSLAEKTSELEKCLVELQEKLSALEAAELSKEELVRSENTLQETLLQRNIVIEKFEEILSVTDLPEEVLSMDIVERLRWLIDDSNKLKGVSLEFNKVKDALSLMHLPETVSSSSLESQVCWLRESFLQAETDLNVLHEEISAVREVAQKEIGRLTASLSAELQTKDYLQAELDNLTYKFQEIVEKEHQLSLEKDQIVKTLLEVSGTAVDNKGVYQPSSDIPMLIKKCFEKMKEQSDASFGSSHFDVELFEEIKNHLYLRDLELMLCELILEEEMVVRSEVNNLSNELRMVSQELVALKEEKVSLQKDLGRSEEKSALVREKLTIAVKKGKGLAQDRESLKLQLDEKNSEIEKLKHDIQQQESALADCRDRISSLSTDVELIPKLEVDLAAIKEQRDQIEQFLVESNNMLQRVIQSIDEINLPVDSVFGEPVSKVKWIAGYIRECQDAKTQAETELVKVQEEVSTLANDLAEAQESIKSLEVALSDAEKNVSQLAEEKREIEVLKNTVEQELQKAMEEASLHASKSAEVYASKNSLEEALSVAENNISMLLSEKESALGSKAAAETELDEVKEEVATQSGKLTEAYMTIKSLEDALSQMESNITLLTKQNDDAQVGRTDLENELKKLQEEAESQASKLADASLTIKSLEDALLKANNNISALEGEKKNAEEISMLNSKLNTYIEELDGSKGSMKSRSVEITAHLNDLQVLVNDDTLLSKVEKYFEKKFNSLKDMDFILMNIRDHFVGMGLEGIRKQQIMEEDTYVTKSFSDHLRDVFNLEKDNDEISITDGDDFSSFRKTVEGFQLRNKTFAEKFEHCSSFIDDFLAVLSRKLEATRDEVLLIFEHIETLKDKLNDLEISKEEQKNTIAFLESDVTTLISACTDATKELQFEVKNNLLELSLLPELEKLKHSLSLEMGEIGGDLSEKVEQRFNGSKYLKEVEMLLLATRKVRALSKQFESTTNLAASAIVDLQNTLKDAETGYEKAIEERDLKQNRISKLDAELEVLQKSCSDLQSTLEEAEIGHKKAIEEEDLKQNRISKLEADVEVLQKSCSELNLIIEDLKQVGTNYEKAIEERDLKQNRVSKLEADVEVLQNSCSELRLKLEDYQAEEDKLKEREAEVSSLLNSLTRKEQEAEHSLSASQLKALFDKISGIQISMAESKLADLEPHSSTHVKKLFYIIENVPDMQHQIKLLSNENEELQVTLAEHTNEIQHLKEEVETHVGDKLDLEKMKNELSDAIFTLEKIIERLGGDVLVGDQISSGVKGLLSVLEHQVMALLLDSESSKLKAQELGAQLVGSQKVVDELSTKVKLLEDSLQGRAVQTEIVQERNIIEAPSLPTGSEISEIEDAGSLGKPTISPVASAAHVRTMRKGSTDHLVLDIDSESSRLINNQETDEDKGHVFKSLNTSGLIPKQGKMVADRIDGIWVSGGRVLMSRPGARLGLIGYWLFLHIWLLASIL